MYKYKIDLPAYGYSDVSKVLGVLTEKFGEDFIEETTINQSYQNAENYKREWNTQKQKVKFNFFYPKGRFTDELYSNDDQLDRLLDITQEPNERMYIEFSYLPMQKNIDTAVKKEESSYF